MIKKLFGCTFAIAVWVSAAAAPVESWSIAGKVVDEAGVSIVLAAVEVDGSTHPVNEHGSFLIDVDHADVALLRISAAGYYSAVHAFQRGSPTGHGAKTTLFELVAKAPQRKLLLFAGDSMLARRYFEPRAGEPQLLRRQHFEEGARQLLKFVKPYVELADYASVNLETQLFAGKPKQRLPKSVTFYSPPEMAALLRWAGFDYVALGNNHTWDYQAEGLASTLRALERAGLDYSGAGLSQSSARQAAVVDVRDQAMNFLSYVGWPGTFTPSQTAAGDKGGAALGTADVIAQDLQRVSAANPTVLQYHSGLEYRERPALSERTQLRRAVDRGVDIAIGHHAHVLQGFEIYQQRLIAYSLGNFLFDQYHYTTQMGMLLYVWMDGETLHRAEVVPLHINGYVPTPATGAYRYSVLHRLARLSRPFGTCLRKNGANAVVAACAGGDGQILDLLQAAPGVAPIHVARLELVAMSPVAFQIDGYSYRLGTDILRRGDFEYAGLFGTHDRAWEVGPDVRIEREESRLLSITVDSDTSVRTGMRVFERVFSASNPTTISGRVRTDSSATVRFLLQRRRTDDTLTAALQAGPTTVVGAMRVSSGDWRNFSFDFNQPRITTRSVRLLIDVRGDDSREGRSTVWLDDLAWVEWRTPWLSGGVDATEGDFATHVQFQPAP
jgi:poly-gamma-glutamate capsule biosynthesis protein CapA/YwtB (metallophosphatase superfamily)